MNYYKHHLGDYDGATAHLSWDEDMAYTRLLRAYYRREAPIPAAEVYRLVRASSKAQKAAVDTVLSEFFKRTDDAWHNKRADEEITTYQAQADTNRRIARERTVQRTVQPTVHEPSTNRPPNQNQNHKPVTNSVTPKRSNGAKPDPAKQEIWTTGRALLVGQGVEKDEAGAFLGRLVKEYGEKKVLEVIRIAKQDPKADLKSWLPAACQERSGKQGALESKNASVVAEALKDVTH